MWVSPKNTPCLHILISHRTCSLLISNQASHISPPGLQPARVIGGINDSIPLTSQVLDHRLRQPLMNLHANQMRSEPIATCPIMWWADTLRNWNTGRSRREGLIEGFDRTSLEGLISLKLPLRWQCFSCKNIHLGIFLPKKNTGGSRGVSRGFLSYTLVDQFSF